MVDTMGQTVGHRVVDNVSKMNSGAQSGQVLEGGQRGTKQVVM